MNAMVDVRRLNALASDYRHAVAELAVHRQYTAMNLGVLREQFLNEVDPSRLDNAELVYPKVVKSALLPLRRVAREVGDLPAHPAVDLFREMVESATDLAVAAMSHSPDLIASTSIRQHGSISRELIAEADRILAEPTSGDGAATIDAESAAERVRRALSRAGLLDWSVTVENAMHARMSVSSAENCVRIRADVRFSPAAVARLIVHEVGTHVFRAANGAAGPLSFLSFGLHGYLATEEGLAVWHEAQSGLLSGADTKKYALRVKAVVSSLQNPISVVVSELLDLTDPLSAFEIGMRSKRGLVHPREPGADVRDQAYLRGFLEVRAHLDSRPGDWSSLMTGKIALGHLDQIRTLREEGLVAAPKYLPDLRS